MIIFTYYSKELFDYLRICNNDLSLCDEMIKASQSEPVWICSHHRTPQGWKEGLTLSMNSRPWEFVEEGGQIVEPNTFYKRHGGVHVPGGF